MAFAAFGSGVEVEGLVEVADIAATETAGAAGVKAWKEARLEGVIPV
jgi:hypothetical protein